MKSTLILLGLVAFLAGLSACSEKGSTEPSRKIVLHDSVPTAPQPPAPGIYRLRDELVGFQFANDWSTNGQSMERFNDSLVRVLASDGIAVIDLWHRAADLCMRPYVDGGMIVRLPAPNSRILAHGFDTVPSVNCSVFWFHYRVTE